MNLYTVGFAQTTAEDFFGKLRAAGIKRVIDTRVHRDGQLSGYAKIPDLQYFLRILTDSVYQECSDLVPTATMLKAYRNKVLTWDQFADLYRNLLLERKPERVLRMADIDQACLLCSEYSSNYCHRGLAAKYFQDVFSNQEKVEIIHL